MCIVRTVWEGVATYPGDPYTTGVTPTGAEAFTTVTTADPEQGTQRNPQRIVQLVRHDTAGFRERLTAALPADATQSRKAADGGRAS
ncbi:hypothetical protein DL991_10075 [Amycolatopsis sp. WAC 01375]|nr:hypothetical protein DL991_10075 [Amycolatopsis sp. WAC 01375]